MRLPATAHTSRPWRIHELAPDFVLEDVWALPTPGGRDDFDELVRQFGGSDFPDRAPLIVRVLWEARLVLGRVFGWDADEGGLRTRVESLRDRFPADLRDAPTGPDLGKLPFEPLYLLDDEWAAEIANKTMHGILHIGWVPDDGGGYRGQMAVLVKPNGRRGEAYMALIKPFRHLFVYPAMLRIIERQWQSPVGTP
ncbi:DUF2867 domain-containing protein [Kribbella sp. NPDC055071]